MRYLPAAALALSLTACGASAGTTTVKTVKATTTVAPTTTTEAPTTTEVKQTAGEWYERYSGQLDDIIAALDSVTAAADAGDLDAVSEGCSNLGSAVRAARGLPPIPVADSERAWRKALDSFESASDACVSGDFSTASDLIRDATGYLTTASEAL